MYHANKLLTGLDFSRQKYDDNDEKRVRELCMCKISYNECEIKIRVREIKIRVREIKIRVREQFKKINCSREVKICVREHFGLKSRA